MLCRDVFIPPCLPTVRDKPPKGDRWMHEVKFDGYRIQRHKRAGLHLFAQRDGV